MTKAKDPHKRTGIFKTLEEVPPGYRLKNYKYESRDPWNEYAATALDDAADTVQYEAELVKDDWRGHMDERDPHFALATPADVESWCKKLLERMTPKRAYNPYWVRLQDFYDYLVWHMNHPHVYHPPLMAAGTGESAARVWDKKMEIGETK